MYLLEGPLLRLAVVLAAAACFTACTPLPSAHRAVDASARVEMHIRNNHDVGYSGPLQFRTDLPDGTYAGSGSIGEVRAGRARIVTSVAARSQSVLTRSSAPSSSLFKSGPMQLTADAAGLQLEWSDRPLAGIEFGLAVIDGTHATIDEALASFQPLPLQWNEVSGGSMQARIEHAGYQLTFTAEPYAGGWLDVNSSISRVSGTGRPGYVALVRRVKSADSHDHRLRFNGRTFEGADSPDTWDRDFWYTRGVDWISWSSGRLTLTAVNAFAPVPTVLRDSSWAEGSHFYVWEKTRLRDRDLHLVSEIAGPNASQPRSGGSRILPYAPLPLGDTVRLRWRFAAQLSPQPDWSESQLLVFAGYRSVTAAPGSALVDLGVSAVSFGTSYFPYSTLAENFDFYRTPGLNSESWWPFSATMWRRWRDFIPRMQTDLHIIRAMGFEWVRLHHLELLQELDRAEALAFLDWFTAVTKQLDLKIFVDTEGPAEWVALIASRYGDVVKRFEIENEILIFGIKPADPRRWTQLYHAAKNIVPDADVFFTSAGNHGMFERLRTLNVPFDRVGLHAYKHGPQWKESFATHALGTGGYAADIGKPATLGEFNWKNLTELSPEARRAEFAAIYELMLAPRALPEFMQFHFQETLTVNPTARQGIRHYETISLDRRPKPEAGELLRLISKYVREDAPVRELTLEIPEVQFVRGSAIAAVTLTNYTNRTLSVDLRSSSFDDLTARVKTPQQVTLRPGTSAHAQVELTLGATAAAGTYHHFVLASYGDKTSYGWGVAAHIGAPSFANAPALADKVAYPQGPAVVNRIDWTKPIYVTFGRGAPILEMEMAYLVGNTLQSASGQRVRISSHADLPARADETGTVIAIGAPATHPMVPRELISDQQGGLVFLQESAGRQTLMLTGHNLRSVQAAATDFVLRYWPQAKDAAIRVTGMEPGAALGHRLRGRLIEVP